MTTGTLGSVVAMSSRDPGSDIPCRRASNVQRCMVGPSASGSLKGKPHSMMAETSAAERSAASLAALVGKPAVRYGMSAERPADRRAAQAGSSRDSDKVVANREPEAVRIRDLHNRPPKRPTLIFFTE